MYPAPVSSSREWNRVELDGKISDCTTYFYSAQIVVLCTVRAIQSRTEIMAVRDKFCTYAVDRGPAQILIESEREVYL